MSYTRKTDRFEYRGFKFVVLEGRDTADWNRVRYCVEPETEYEHSAHSYWEDTKEKAIAEAKKNVDLFFEPTSNIEELAQKIDDTLVRDYDFAKVSPIVLEIILQNYKPLNNE